MIQIYIILLKKYVLCYDNRKRWFIMLKITKHTTFNGAEVLAPLSTTAKQALSDNLKRIRMRAGFSQKELAEKMNIPAPTISRYEKGQQEPSLSAVKKMAEVLQCSIDELVGHKIPRNFDAIAQYWHELLFPSFSVSFDHEQQSFVIAVLQEMETILYKFNAGKKLIIHHTAFAMYEEKIIEFMDKDLYKNKKELAVLYFARMIEAIQLSSGIVLPNKGEFSAEE